MAPAWPGNGHDASHRRLLAAEIGPTVRIRRVPTLAVRTMGLFSPMMRGLAEMAYEFEEPFVLDTSSIARRSTRTPHR